jgi:hypothetical protein
VPVCVAAPTAEAGTTTPTSVVAMAAAPHCHPRRIVRLVPRGARANPEPDIVILRENETDGGFATRSPPAQATKYGPADHCVVLEGRSPRIPT